MRITHKINKTRLLIQDSGITDMINGIQQSITIIQITIETQNIFHILSHVISRKKFHTFCTNHLATLIENHNNQIAKTKPAISLNKLKDISDSPKIDDITQSNSPVTIPIQNIIKNITKYFHAYHLRQTKSQDQLLYVPRHARSPSCTKSESLKD